jgi:hypothetical protein
VTGTPANAAAELAVHAAAAAANANAAELCDSVSFMKRVEALDPQQSGFVTRVAGEVRAAAASDPRFRAQAAPVAGTPEPRQWTMADVEAASPSEISAASDAGLLLEHLHVGPPRKRRGY